MEPRQAWRQLEVGWQREVEPQAGERRQRWQREVEAQAAQRLLERGLRPRGGAVLLRLRPGAMLQVPLQGGQLRRIIAWQLTHRPPGWQPSRHRAVCPCTVICCRAATC